MDQNPLLNLQRWGRLCSFCWSSLVLVNKRLSSKFSEVSPNWQAPNEGGMECFDSRTNQEDNSLSINNLQLALSQQSLSDFCRFWQSCSLNSFKSFKDFQAYSNDYWYYCHFHSSKNLFWFFGNNYTVLTTLSGVHYSKCFPTF